MHAILMQRITNTSVSG